jgi:hypothetical protein
MCRVTNNNRMSSPTNPSPQWRQLSQRPTFTFRCMLNNASYPLLKLLKSLSHLIHISIDCELSRSDIIRWMMHLEIVKVRNRSSNEDLSRSEPTPERTQKFFSAALLKYTDRSAVSVGTLRALRDCIAVWSEPFADYGSDAQILVRFSRSQLKRF